MKDLKSAMSTKVYWKARKLIQSIGFRCKSLLYTYMDNQTGKSKSLPDDFNRVFVKRVKRDIEDLEDLLIGGFPNYSIVEFFNSHHPDPNDPDVSEQMNDQFPEGMFRFEKVMKS